MGSHTLSEGHKENGSMCMSGCGRGKLVEDGIEEAKKQQPYDGKLPADIPYQPL